MSFIINPQVLNSSIVTSGLVMNLVASNIRSYNLTGNWNDLTGNNNNGTFSGTQPPTYNRGVFDFRYSGNSRFVIPATSTNNISTGSLGVWVRQTGPNQATGGGGLYQGIVIKQNSWGLFSLGNNNNLIAYGWFGTGIILNTGINIFDSQWRYVVVTFNQMGTTSGFGRVYVNGDLTVSGIFRSSIFNNIVTIGHGNFSNQYFNGSIGETHLYNRVLTDAEVLENFNATRWWYGI